MHARSDRSRSSRFARNHARRGAIIAVFAITLPVVLLIGSFAIYVAWAQLIRSEHRTATDFAARAGAKKLSLSQSVPAAQASAIEAAARNKVAGAAMQLSPSEIDFGFSQQASTAGKFVFTPGGSQLNSVRVRSSIGSSDQISSTLKRLTGIANDDYANNAVATNLNRDICVVIDRSGSMTLTIDGSGTGLEQNCGPLPSNCKFASLVTALDAFVQELNATPQAEKVSLVSYSSPVDVDCGAGQRVLFDTTSVHSTLAFSTSNVMVPVIEMLNNGIGGATAIGDGLRVGIATVTGAGRRPFAAPTIVIMTDGNQNLGEDPLVVAQAAKDQQIVVHTITFSTGANQTLMQEVASLTGGVHLHADTAADLSASFREIARSLPVMLTQ